MNLFFSISDAFAEVVSSIMQKLFVVFPLLVLAFIMLLIPMQASASAEAIHFGSPLGALIGVAMLVSSGALIVLLLLPTFKFWGNARSANNWFPGYGGQ